MPRTAPGRCGSLPVPAVLALLTALLFAALSACSSGSGAVSSVPSSSAAGSAPANAPTRVAVPSIGVDSTLMRLGLNKDQTVEVPPPDKGMTAGWYTGSAVPGDQGAAVIIGHNDTRYGKAVFHDLKKVKKGADIAVRTADGETRHFTVTNTERVAKNAFPTDKVYGPNPKPVLRLVTCDGALDASGHPEDNLIVYAALRTG
ncbi:class F sortase [Streptomyces silvisoli]|uniref:Class F sortase n=1 Tax=Streptomyces silvisoli TaxID=3034235 RepID=A0ABT5ZU19_9ACTN|nr:class F sortase [Streptomyces silvisoli]MDF3293317.1 class F sortase [Streptomyces silvisoli]